MRDAAGSFAEHSGRMKVLAKRAPLRTGLSAAAIALLMLALPCRAAPPATAQTPIADGYSIVMGKADRNHSRETVENGYLLRLGLRRNWLQHKFTAGWRWRGFWAYELGYWRWDDEEGSESDDNSLLELALSPVFRLERATPYQIGIKPFIEATVGLHLISQTHVSARDLSSKYLFGSFLGSGFYFGEHDRYEVSLRIHHLSNAGLEPPNPGINYALLSFAFRP